MDTEKIIIRPACLDDAEKLLELYRPYVTDTAITFEYQVPTVEEFKGRMERTLARYPYLVAIDNNDNILGYTYASAFRPRAAYDWSVETSIYVNMGKKSKGIGTRLYTLLEKILKKQHILNLNACIAYPVAEQDPFLSLGSVEFHEAMKYKTVGRFHKSGYKFNTWYDMIWMEKIIGEHSETPEPVIPFSQVRHEFFTEQRGENNR